MTAPDSFHRTLDARLGERGEGDPASIEDLMEAAL